MPRITIHPDKDDTLVVCCDDDDCVEIAVSGNSDGSGSSGGSGGTDYEPETGGFALKRALTYTVELDPANPYEDLSHEVTTKKAAFSEARQQDSDLMFQLAILLPSGAPLKLRRMKEIADELGADISVSFSHKN